MVKAVVWVVLWPAACRAGEAAQCSKKCAVVQYLRVSCLTWRRNKKRPLRAVLLEEPCPEGRGRINSDHEQRATRKSLTRVLLGLAQANDV